MVGKKQNQADQVSAGDIGAVTNCDVTATNDTLCDRSKVLTLPQIEFPVPCLTMAIVPKSKARKTRSCQASTSLRTKTRCLTWSTILRRGSWSYPDLASSRSMSCAAS
jgi:elongation factor G